VPAHCVPCLRWLSLRHLRPQPVRGVCRCRVFENAQQRESRPFAYLCMSLLPPPSNSILRAFIIEEQKIVKQVILEKLRKRKAKKN